MVTINLVLDQNLDTENYRNIHNPRARENILKIIEENEYIDVWRVLNENKMKYTVRRLNPVKKQARLDFFIVSEDIFQLVTKSSIVSGYRTDHSGISLKIKFQDAERGQGYWKFNNSLLKDKDYIKIVKDAIEETKDIYANNNNTLGVNINNQYIIDDQLLLETLLFTIRGETIKYSSRKKRETLQEGKKLEEEIELLEENLNNNLLTIDNHEILLLEEKRNKLYDIRQKKLEDVML